MRFLLRGWLLLLLLAPAVVPAASIYSCRGANGVTSFQDQPCPDAVPAATSAPRPAATAERPFLWRTRINGNDVYLLGSIHFGKRDFYPLPAVITDAFQRAPVLAVEANILEVDPMQVAQRLLQDGSYTDGRQLQRVVAPSTWQGLQRAADKLQLPLELLNNQRPWLVAMTLTTAGLQRHGYSEEWGIDRQLLQQARGSKRIIELESVEQQLSLLARLTPAEQEGMLKDALRQLEQNGNYFDTLVGAWRRGDAQALNALMDESWGEADHGARLRQLLIVNRNHAMVGKIEQQARQGGVFVVVGAAHLVGKDGIVQLLRNKGYRLDGP